MLISSTYYKLSKLLHALNSSL